MSLFDRVTKAVGDAVDRGKKEVDQFMRIQKINGQIGDVEKRVAEFKSQIQQTKIQIGEQAVGMLRAGTLASPDLQALVDRITATEQQIGQEEAAIADLRADIEKIKAEDQALPAAAAPAEPAPSPAPPAPAEPPVSARFCPQCGAQAGASPFCSECGTKL